LKNYIQSSEIQPSGQDMGNRARTTTKALNIVSFILTLWTIFFPLPYAALIIGCLILPLVSVYVMASAKGLVKLDAAKRSKEPNIAIAFIGPCIALCLRAVFDVQFVSYKPALVPTLLVGLALTALTCTYAPEVRRKPLNVLLVLPFALCYGYGFFVELNCLPDTSRPAEYTTRIINKRISNGNRGSKYYYLDVLPCGPFTTTQEVRVSRNRFQTYTNNEETTVRVKDGTLGAKWFSIAPKKRG
jgi:hypothetical protein